MTVVNASGVKVPDPTQASDADKLKEQRQAQAAAARAAKANKTAPATKPAAAPPVDDVAGTNGTGDQDDSQDEDMGLDPPSMSPGEAKDAALALVREAYSSGHVAQVKALQKELQVAKFYDVPVEQGHKFYQRVMRLAQRVGIRQ